MLVGFGLPLALALAALGWLLVQVGPELLFVWHLATRA